MVTAVIVMGNTGGAFGANVALVAACVAAGLLVQHVAPMIAALCGWQRFAANAAMTLTAGAALVMVAHPQLVKAQVAAMMECLCMWGWEAWCCYF